MPKIIFTAHARIKFTILERHGFKVTPDQVIQTLLTPDTLIQLATGELVAQRNFTERHLLRVVHRQEQDNWIVITFYPGRRSRYET